MDYLIIVAKATNDNYTCCNPGEEADAIKRAEEYYKKEVAILKSRLEEYPNMTEFFTRQLERADKNLSHGFEAITFDEYFEREKKAVCTKPKETSAEYYDEKLCVLPPLNWFQGEDCEWFFMSEFNTLSFTEQNYYDKRTGKYYCAIVDINDKSTWIDKNL